MCVLFVVGSVTFDAKNGRVHDSVVVNMLARLLEKVIDPRKHWLDDHREDKKKGDKRKKKV